MTAASPNPMPERDAQQDAWWRGAVIYQVYPRSFHDLSGDGIGDLPGLASRLDHIASLGVDAVWVSPFFKSPMADFGYDVEDYCAVDPMFGTMQDFDRLIEKAHGLGLRILIDQVYSHTADTHAWFRESRASRDNARADWYVWADPKPDGSPPSNWQSVFGGPAWTWDARRGQYYLHNFLSAQPQLNLHHPDVQQAILDVMRFWLDRGVDGFRLDAVSFMMHDPELRDNPPRGEDAWLRTRPFDFQKHLYNQSHPDIVSFLRRLRALADNYGKRYIVAEIDREHADAEMKAFTEGEDTLQSAYGFTFLYASQLTPNLVKTAMREWPGNPGEGWPSWAFSNHDAPRAVSRWAAGRDATAFAHMAMLLLTCLRGNIFLYQGEELGLPQAHVPFEHLKDPEAITNWPHTLGRDGARTPMPWMADAANAGFSAGDAPWLPVPVEHAALAVDRQDADPASTLNHTRRALALRRNLPALRAGKLRFLDVDEPLVAFERGEGDDTVLCVFNLGDADMAFTPEPAWTIVESVNGADPASGVLAPLQGWVATRR